MATKRNRKLYWLLGSSMILWLAHFLLGTGFETEIGIWLKAMSYLFLIGTWGSFIIFRLKKNRLAYRITLLLNSFLLVSSILLLSLWGLIEEHNSQRSEIEKISSCEMAEKQFKIDLKNDDLKYFTFGIAADEMETIYLRTRYDLEVWHMGCLFDSNLICYNDLVRKHLKMNEETSTRLE
ncbi:hypothetical protein [Croceimicrobium hydrocarbonivorans]|uniref:Uncharacterized protein n=1 Tax=Croceimicrobium hydrocarbonivorans TaxID=2761580 RepID=A0A7H0VDR0_9FLAO|nr:hypothetical protein [Croceimicrobium hydrocarbonivorans]QNR23858.1 hypothetical protein H4K34_16000 [Croceimicrobium hydrocarbonivorans]